MVVSHTATGFNRCRVNTRDIHILPDDHPIGRSLGKGSISPFTITRFPVIDLVGWLLILFVGTQQRRIGIGTADNVAIEHPWQLYVIHIVTLPANKASIFLALVWFS